MLKCISNTEDVSSSQLPMRTFYAQVQKQKQVSILLTPSLKTVHNFFLQDNDVWFDQCSWAITTLEEMKKPIWELCKLFNEPARMPPSLSLESYQCMILFYHIHEQICILLSLITLFRSIYLSKPKLASKRRQEITYHMDLLIRGSNNIEHKVQDFAFSYDRIRFQQHHLETNLGEL